MIWGSGAHINFSMEDVKNLEKIFLLMEKVGQKNQKCGFGGLMKNSKR
ncbi:MAG: hypothetical protein CM1200mP5_4450 [Candidatus Pelagibacterales bacterium]|nr:MAG: hypothetical protein CM1200mP5_4450 [Pelagibacterales bacterium]